MSLPVQTPYNIYTGNGAATVYPYEFRLLAAADLQVTLDGVTTGAYTLTGVGNNDGGTVIFSAAPANGVEVAIRRVVSLARATDYQTAGDFMAATVNADLDRIWMAMQERDTDNARSIRVPFPETTDDISDAETRADRLLGFNSNGDPTVVIPTAGDASALAVDLASSNAAAKGSGQVGFSQSLSYAAGTVGAKLRTLVSVRDAPYNAKGDGVTDDTAAIQAAITAVRALPNGVLFFPPNDPSDYYKTTAPLTVDGPITIRGSGPNSTTILGVGLSAGQYVLDIDCLAANVVEHLEVSGLTLRSNNATPNGMRIKNASYVLIKQVQLYNLSYGLKIEGTRCFSNFYEQLTCYVITNESVRFAAHTGGGQHTFKDSTFTGGTGFAIDNATVTDGISLVGCNFEQCVVNSFYCGGTVNGLSFVGCRTEGCDGASDFLIDPAVGKAVYGLIVHGCMFTADAGAIYPIQLGGTGGKVRGFSICGNSAGYAAVGTNFVRLNGEGESGIIAGNYLNEATAGLVNVQRAGVAVFANENVSGKFAEYWGLADWGVVQGNWTPTDGSGAGLSLTAAGRYTKIGREIRWQAFIQYPATGSGANAEIAGLPFAVGGLGGNSEGRAGAHVDICNVGSAVGILQGVTSTTEFAFYNPTTGTAITNATLSGKYLYCSGSYSM